MISLANVSTRILEMLVKTENSKETRWYVLPYGLMCYNQSHTTGFPETSCVERFPKAPPKIGERNWQSTFLTSQQVALKIDLLAASDSLQLVRFGLRLQPRSNFDATRQLGDCARVSLHFHDFCTIPKRLSS
jgi:hypothetical protein